MKFWQIGLYLELFVFEAKIEESQSLLKVNRSDFPGLRGILKTLKVLSNSTKTLKPSNNLHKKMGLLIFNI